MKPCRKRDVDPFEYAYNAPDRVDKNNALVPDAKFNPTVNDVAKVYGYNAANVEILSIVSKRINEYTEALGIINDLHNPVDLVKIMDLCQAMDSSWFRTVLSDAFTKLVSEELTVADTVKEYLFGTAPVVTPPKTDGTNVVSGTTSNDGITVVVNPTKPDNDGKTVEINPASTTNSSAPSTGSTTTVVPGATTADSNSSTSDTTKSTTDTTILGGTGSATTVPVTP